MLSTKEQIGKKDRKITIQEKVYTTNASNERHVSGWHNITNYPNPWAEVKENYGSEELQADQLSGLKTSTFIIRFREDITEENRIIDGDEIYNIIVCLKIGRKGSLKIIAESGGQFKEA